MVTVPKTPAGVREITLPDWLRPILTAHIASRRLGADDWLFPSPTGGLTNPRNFRRRFWKPAVAAAGNPQLTPHQLRHLQVSLLVEAGRPITEVAARLGHANTRVTGAVYAHWLKGDDSGAAEVVPDFAAGKRRGDLAGEARAASADP